MHLGVYGMTEALHRELQPLRRNVFEVIACLREAGVFFALNHLLHFYRGQTPLDDYLRLLDEVPALEARNGAMLPAHNLLVEAIVARRTAGNADARWRRSAAATRTRCAASAAPGPRRRARNREEFLDSLRAAGPPGGEHGDAATVAGDAYGVIGSYVASLIGLGPRDHAAGIAPAASRSAPSRCRFSSCRWRLRWPGSAREAETVRRVAAELNAVAARRAAPARSDRRRAVVNDTVVITGIGLVTALGTTREETWQRMLAGECGIRHAELFDTDGYRSRVAAEVRHERVERRVHAARAPPAVAQRSHRRGGRHRGARGCGPARRPARSLARRRVAGRRHRRSPAQRNLLQHVDDIRASRARARRMCGIISRARRWTPSRSASASRARASCVVAACSSSTIAIGQAADAIRRGRADAVLAGGTDALSRLTFSGFNALRLMDPAPCRPFDRSRAGMNIGEGAAILVLEELDRARRRGARIYGELAGYGFACEAFHPTAPEPEGRPVAAVIAAALRHGRVECRRGRSHQRARHRDAAERRRRGARVPPRVRRPHRADPGHLAEIDDRPLPGRGRRDRSRRAGADDRARRHPADDQPRDRRLRRAASSRTSRASSVCARACRRRWGLAGTTRRS